MSSRGNFFYINITSKGSTFPDHVSSTNAISTLPSLFPLLPLAWSNLFKASARRKGEWRQRRPPAEPQGEWKMGKVERRFLLLLWLRVTTQVCVSPLLISLWYSVLSCHSTYQKNPSFIRLPIQKNSPSFPFRNFLQTFLLWRQCSSEKKLIFQQTQTRLMTCVWVINGLFSNTGCLIESWVCYLSYSAKPDP